MCVFFNGKITIHILETVRDKWHTFCQIRCRSSTLDDLEGHWQPVWSAILASAGLLLLFSMCKVQSVNQPIQLFYPFKVSEFALPCLGKGRVQSPVSCGSWVISYGRWRSVALTGFSIKSCAHPTEPVCQSVSQFLCLLFSHKSDVYRAANDTAYNSTCLQRTGRQDGQHFMLYSLLGEIAQAILFIAANFSIAGFFCLLSVTRPHPA